ncbi:hypothetical protein DFP74_1440 [Nocardiopsis sp. Huas11]|uniref:ABC transporter substrate-binding protein n=1 Tax=Nocardiopsis sp. Huas11 TaxID=2183912 RepID=UPI000EAB87D4|nr:ABC transporter substrate-binding protein [Nocardiopsis sp. Huas11]RKS05828.1 hypothetical protein DFP74_1440 [Nocardiopsis sp. Huas11]
MAEDKTDVRDDDVSAFLHLEVFDALRERPGRGLPRAVARLERRAARRIPVVRHSRVQRGDIAEPPPVLDLEVPVGLDRGAVVRDLAERCGPHPVWRLPLDDADTARGRVRDPEPRATTDELYDLMGRLVERADRDHPAAGRLRRPPPKARFRRLRSLLLLRECDFDKVRGDVLQQQEAEKKVTGETEARAKEARQPLKDGQRAQIHVIAELRRVRLEHLKRQASAARARDPEERRSRLGLLDHYSRALHTAAAWIARLSAGVSFGRFDERLITPLGFAVNLVAFVAPLVLGTVSVVNALNTVAQGVNNIAGAVAAAVLFVVYCSLAPFLVLPWRSYRWLNRHGYVTDKGDADGPTNHRSRGIQVLNLLHLQGDAVGYCVPDSEPAGPRDASAPRRPAAARRPAPAAPSWWSRLTGTDRPRPAPAADRSRADRTRADRPGPGGDRPRPPRVHQLAVNAFLDDLADVYGGTVRRRFAARRKRDQRPVLIVDQHRLDRVGRYLVRLIEDERLRRGLPDPLLIVQVRGAREPSLVDGVADPCRHTSLPGADDAPIRPEHVAQWSYARYTAGLLGRERTLTVPVSGVPGQWERHAGPRSDRWVLTVPALVGAWTGGTVVALAPIVLLAWTVVPTAVQERNPCVAEGVLPPRGIVRHGDDCVGVTDGEFEFHDRLAEVGARVHEQNEAVGDDAPYVTVAYVGELTALGDDDLALAGVQGELLGLAHQQREHNQSAGTSEVPAIKLLLANTGVGWAHAEEVAAMIVERSQDERLGMDRPIAAVGFGHSVQPNTDAILELGAARITMVGTTATYDQVASVGSEYSQYFFPLAPSNTRIARQAATWAYDGVRWNGADLVGEGTEPHLLPARTAVAIADNDVGESYGPHLAVEFMAEFEALGGRPWSDGTDPEPVSVGQSPQSVDGVLPYRSGGTSIAEHLERVCADDPPDLLYFAGRSVDFMDVHIQLQEEGVCPEADMAVLGGDDIAKFVTDNADVIGRASDYPVFYTPLAASGAWSQYTGMSERAFYEAAEALVEELYGDDAEGADESDGEADADADGEADAADGGRGTDDALVAADAGLPSTAHAVMANDGLRVIARALRGIDRATPLAAEDAPAPAPSPSPTASPSAQASPYLSTATGFDRERGELFTNVQDTVGLTGVSGYIGFGQGDQGNWYEERMIQLVAVGPQDTDGRRQHVVAACGRVAARTVIERGCR